MVKNLTVEDKKTDKLTLGWLVYYVGSKRTRSKQIADNTSMINLERKLININ